eukprot:PhM_4_TR4289/c0_g1_i1/m.93396
MKRMRSPVRATSNNKQHSSHENNNSNTASWRTLTEYVRHINGFAPYHPCERHFTRTPTTEPIRSVLASEVTGAKLHGPPVTSMDLAATLGTVECSIRTSEVVNVLKELRDELCLYHDLNAALRTQETMLKELGSASLALSSSAKKTKLT